MCTPFEVMRFSCAENLRVHVCFDRTRCGCHVGKREICQGVAKMHRMDKQGNALGMISKIIQCNAVIKHN